MKTNKERKSRFSLTLLFSAVVMLLFISVLVLVGVGLYFLNRAGVLSGPERLDIPATELILIFIGASIVIGSGMTLLLSKYPLKPVNDLLNIIHRLASGDFSVRITLPKPWDKNPSIVELSDSFNKMAEELQGTEMLRSDFINNFSHEFKTPIVSIAGFAKLLRKEQLTEQQAEYVRIIEEESRRLSDMATNVLIMTKVENQTILTGVETYNLSEQLRSCILLLCSKWEEKGIDFSLDFHEHNVTGSEELLTHVWINLIDNAIKFSPQNGTVDIAIVEQPGLIEVSVANHGIEISPEQQQKIFRKFYQADESHATQGNGVGLSIVKMVVDLHSGTISVRSENGITTFSVSLPQPE